MWFGERKCSGWYNLCSYRRRWLKWTYQTRWAPYGLPDTCEHMASGHSKRPGKVCGDCQEFLPSPCRNNEADHQGLDMLLTVMPDSRRLWNTKQSLGEVSSNHQAMACPLLSLRTWNWRASTSTVLRTGIRTPPTSENREQRLSCEPGRLRQSQKDTCYNTTRSLGVHSKDFSPALITQCHWTQQTFNKRTENNFNSVRLCPKTQSKT